MLFRSQKSMQIPSENITYDEQVDFVGEGQFGTVYRAQLQGLNVAVKVSHETCFTADQIRAFVNEMEIMKNSHHPNVVLFMGVSVSAGRIMLVTELLTADLGELIHHRKDSLRPEILSCNLTTELKLSIIEQCCRGIQWLHNGLDLVHRDIKPANFLLDPMFHVKVCDFGFAEFVQKQSGVAKGSPLYCAPEVWDKKCGKPVDVYALAITMWELFYERLPFEDFLKDADKFKKFVCTGGRPTLPNTFLDQIEKRGEMEQMKSTIVLVEKNYGVLAKQIPKYIESIMECAWEQDPSKRADINKMLSMVEEAKLSHALGKRSAMMWWKKHFSTKGGEIEGKVSVDTFLKALVATHGVKGFDENAVKGVLSDTNEVSIEFFGHLIQLFGPFYKKKEVFKLLIQIAESDWFFNTITKDESQSQLEGRIDKTFLVRVSTTNPKFPFTLSKRTDGKTTHTRIERSEPKKDQTLYTLKAKIGTYTASNLIQLIEDLQQDGVIGEPCSKDDKVSEY